MKSCTRPLPCKMPRATMGREQLDIREPGRPPQPELSSWRVCLRDGRHQGHQSVAVPADLAAEFTCVWGGQGAQIHPHPMCARVEREGYRTFPRGTELLLSFLSVTRFLEKKNPLQGRKVLFQLLGSCFTFTLWRGRT